MSADNNFYVRGARPEGETVKAVFPDVTYKVAIYGDSGVGKSCIVLRACTGEFSDAYISTIGCDFMPKTMEHEGKNIRLHIWDIAGEKRFRTIVSNSFRGQHLQLFVFDVTDRLSFNNLKETLAGNTGEHDLKPSHYSGENVVRVLVGSKIDLDTKRAVSDEEANAYAKSIGIPYTACSAKTGEGIEQMFRASVALLEKQRAEKEIPADKTFAKKEDTRRDGGKGGCCIVS